MAPHRILYLIGQLSVGGAERQLIYLATHLDRSRFEPVVCSLTAEVSWADDLHAAGVKLVVLPKRMSPDLTRLWRVPQLVRQYRPALIHSYLFVANTWARTTGLLCNVPVIVSERNAQEDGSRLRRTVDRILSPASAMLVANSHAGGELAVRTGRIARDRLAVIHNGIALPPFRGPSIGMQVREELGVGAHDPLVGTVGRLVEAKDHATFFDAMACVAATMPDVHILCVGDGPLRGFLYEQVARLGLQNRTIFTGMRSDIPAIMSALDLLVLSSKHEGFPNVVMEAMAAARPVVATRVGDVERLVLHGETGLLVPPGDAAALAEAVLSVLRDISLSVEMGRRGRVRIEEDFSLERMVRSSESLYRRVLTGDAPEAS